MKQQLNVKPAVSPYNECVRLAYFQILKQAKGMLATIDQEELRHMLERQDKPNMSIGHVIHEIVNPLIYLRLEGHSNGVYTINFGIESLSELGQLSDITTRFLRSIYKRTTKGTFPVDIECSVKTNLFIHNVSGLYEYLEESEKYKFKVIPYKVTSSERKRILSVA